MWRIIFGRITYGHVVRKHQYYCIQCLSCSVGYVNSASNQEIKNNLFNLQKQSNIHVRNHSNLQNHDKTQNKSNIQNNSNIQNQSDIQNQSNTENKSSEKQQQNANKPAVVLFRKFRYIVDIFWNGFKNLVSDVKLALQIRRKLGLYHRRDYSKLSREEVRHMQQTREDVVKTFPVTLLFLIPFVGYAAPILAYFYPKQLLSQQFWHPDQRKEFILEEYEKRSQYYLPLIKELAVTCKEIKSRDLYKLCLKVINGGHPLNSDLLAFKDEFSRFEDFSLRNVPRYHLVKLCKCWLIPTGWFLPRWYLMKALKRRITLLHNDDLLILREGIDALSNECISKAVHVRGLDESSLNMPSQILWLKEWLDLSSNVSAADVSFLAHCAAFKAANFENIMSRNLNGNQNSNGDLS